MQSRSTQQLPSTGFGRMSNNVKAKNSDVSKIWAMYKRPDTRSECAHFVSSEIKKWMLDNGCARSEIPFPTSHRFVSFFDDDFLAKIREYLEGASLAMDPLPSKIRSTYDNSNAHAMHLDWKVTANDLRDVYSAIIESIDHSALAIPSSEASIKAKNDKKRSAD